MSYPAPTISAPAEDELADMLTDSVMNTGPVGFETSDGCLTDHDGTCPHGHPTWLIRYGLI